MVGNTFLKFFPVPKLLAMPATGFDLSSDSIKFIEITRHKERLKIGRYGKIDLPHGLIDRGRIQDEAALKKMINDMRSKYRLKHVNVSLPEEKAYVFNLTIPYVEPHEIRGSVELQLEEHVPLPADSVVFDYDLIRYNRETDEIELNISVLERDIVENYLRIFEESGLEPLVFETEAQALARAAIPKSSKLHKGTYMIVDFGNSRTSFSIISEGFVAFNSTLDFGGDDITNAIVKDLGVTFAEAEQMKIEQGLGGRDSKDAIFSAALSSLAVLKDEVTKYYTYWNSRVGKEPGKREEVGKILFCGGVSALKGLPEFLASYLEIPFELANPWVNVLSVEEEIPPIHRADALKYCVAIGLALSPILES